MGATVGSLAVNIIAKHDSFVKGINQARAATQKFEVGLGGLARKLGGLFAGVQVISFLRNTAQEMDHLAKSARQMGLTAEEMQRWTMAAQIGGSSIESVERAMRRMQRAVDDASIGLVTSQRAFQRLGLSAEDVQKQLPGQQLETVSTALFKMENVVERNAMAMTIFGRSGLEMITTMEGINSEAERFQKTGFLSEEQLAQVEQFNDVVTRTGQQLKLWSVGALTAFAGDKPNIIGPPDELKAYQLAQERAMNSAAQLAAGIQQKIMDVTGEATHAMEIERLVALGISEEMERTLTSLSEQHQILVKQNEEMTKLTAAAERITSAMRSPLEIMKDDLTEVFTLWQENLISAETYSRAIAKISDDFRQTQRTQERADSLSTSPIAAVERGTVAGFSAVQAAIRSQRDHAREQARTEQDQLREQKRITDAVKEVRRAVEGIQINEVSLD